jgi:hypothetical protein
VAGRRRIGAAGSASCVVAAGAGFDGGAWKTTLATCVAETGCALASAAGRAKSGIRKGRVVGGGSSRLGWERAARGAEKGWIDEVAMSGVSLSGTDRRATIGMATTRELPAAARSLRSDTTRGWVVRAGTSG